MQIAINNCLVFDGYSPILAEKSILIRDGIIAEIVDQPIMTDTAEIYDARGRFVMPGLIDTHFHAYAAEVNLGVLDKTRPELRALYARKALEEALQRGFTTVRDAAGGDIALATALRSGLINGPRFFYPGLALSQTGGHGDMRGPGFQCGCAYCGSITTLADGADEVRKAAREQLRLGATQIKLFLSGGVASPSDPYWMAQYCDEEIQAAVHEASTRNAYVMAHAHTADSVMRCIRNGVRSIEHATIITKEAADAIAEADDVYVVPTLVTLRKLVEYGTDFGLPAVSLAKTKEVEAHALRSLELLYISGAKVGFGTDLLGPLMTYQLEEFSLRREIVSPLEILRSVTSTNAAIIQSPDSLGRIQPGFLADVLVVDGNPLEDVLVLTRRENMAAIMRGDEFIKNTLVLN